MSASSDSLIFLKEKVEEQLSSPSLETSQDLKKIATAIADSSNLRNALTDPSRSSSLKQQLAQKLFGSEITSNSLEALCDALSQRWNRGIDLVHALMTVAQLHAISVAEKNGTLDTLETELLHFSNALDQYPDIAQSLNNSLAPISSKMLLIEKLSSHFSDSAQVLLLQSLSSRYGLRAKVSLQEVITLVAERKKRSIATVDSPIHLSVSQKEKLSAGLSKMHGRPITINTRIKPELLGGIRVQLGDEVIDGTMSSRLGALRQNIAAS